MALPSEKTPSAYWLVGAIIAIVVLLLAAYLFTGFLSIPLLAGLLVLGVGIVTAGFFILRIFLKSSSMPQGWAHPVLSAKKARKELGLPEKEARRDLSQDGPIQKDGKGIEFRTDTDNLDPKDISGEFIQMGRLLLKSGRYPEAKEAFVKAAEQDPGNSKVYNYLGIACGRLNEHEEAVDAYNKAIALDYDYASAHFNLASVFDQIHDDKNAISQWKRYLDVGKVVGEREDMLERAKGRLQTLKNGDKKVKKSNAQTSSDDNPDASQ